MICLSGTRARRVPFERRIEDRTRPRLSYRNPPRRELRKLRAPLASSRSGAGLASGVPIRARGYRMLGWRGVLWRSTQDYAGRGPQIRWCQRNRALQPGSTPVMILRSGGGPHLSRTTLVGHGPMCCIDARTCIASNGPHCSGCCSGDNLLVGTLARSRSSMSAAPSQPRFCCPCHRDAIPLHSCGFQRMWPRWACRARSRGGRRHGSVRRLAGVPYRLPEGRR